VAQLCRQALGYLFVAFYDSQSYSGGILSHLHTVTIHLPLELILCSVQRSIDAVCYQNVTQHRYDFCAQRDNHGIHVQQLKESLGSPNADIAESECILQTSRTFHFHIGDTN
jgi:hypothetical protein